MPKGQTMCVHHKGKQLELFCKTCDLVTCSKCLSSFHSAHQICDLCEITPAKKLIIEDFISNKETTELVQVNTYIKSTEKQLRDNFSRFQKLASDLTTQYVKLKQALDVLVAETLSVYQQLEEENAALLTNYKSDLESYKSQLNQLLLECKSTLQRGTDLDVCDTSCEIHSRVPHPKTPSLGTASFAANTNPRGDLERALGTVSTCDQGQSSSDYNRSAGSSGHQRLSPTQPGSDAGNTETRPPPRHTRLPQTKVVGEFKASFHVTSICPTSDGNAWVCHEFSRTLTLLNGKGVKQQAIQYNNNITDISLSPSTNSLWSCHRDHNIMELVSGQPTIRFKVNSKPKSICVTTDEHVIVGMKGHISKFTTEGTLVLTTKTTGAGKHLVSTPRRISECRVTGNVGVVDWDFKDVGGKGKEHIVVLDKNFGELFRYTGVVPDITQQNTKQELNAFSPYGLVYDSVGDLVIVDFGNKRVVLISGGGEFLRIIYTDTTRPCAIRIDRDDALWVVFRLEDIKLLQYKRV